LKIGERSKLILGMSPHTSPNPVGVGVNSCIVFLHLPRENKVRTRIMVNTKRRPDIWRMNVKFWPNPSSIVHVLRYSALKPF